MSKTERDLSSERGGDAFDALFGDTSFDSAFDDAIENADLELDIDEADPDDEHAPGADGELDDVDGDEGELDADVVDSATSHDHADDETSDVDAVEVEEDVDDLAEDDDPDADAELVEESSGELDEQLIDDDEGVDDEGVEVEGVEDDDLDAESDLDADEAMEIDADLDDRSDDDDALPEIVPATPDIEVRAPAGDPESDESLESDDVSEDILEELRRADIDGPVVPHAPQDDTTTAVRRPRRSADYDPAPVPIPAKVPRVLGRKPRVRKVTRVVRHVDPWSVFKIAIIAHLVLYIIVLTASVLLWNVANATGTVDNVERFFESFGWNSFEFNGGELYHAGWIAGLFVVIGLTGLAVLVATLFNLITDLVGGVRFTVLEEEVLETRTSPMRRFVVRRSEPEVPALLNDSSGAMYREAVVDDAGANHRPTR